MLRSVEPNSAAIVQAMLDKAITRQQLSSVSGLGSRTITKVLNGHKVSPDTIASVAKALDRKYGEFVLRHDATTRALDDVVPLMSEHRRRVSRLFRSDPPAETDGRHSDDNFDLQLTSIAGEALIGRRMLEALRPEQCFVLVLLTMGVSRTGMAKRLACTEEEVNALLDDALSHCRSWMRSLGGSASGA